MQMTAVFTYTSSNICKVPRNTGYMEINIKQFTHYHKLSDVIKLTPTEDDKLKRYEYVVFFNSGRTILVKEKVKLY